MTWLMYKMYLKLNCLIIIVCNKYYFGNHACNNYYFGNHVGNVGKIASNKCCFSNLAGNYVYYFGNIASNKNTILVTLQAIITILVTMQAVSTILVILQATYLQLWWYCKQ